MKIEEIDQIEFDALSDADKWRFYRDATHKLLAVAKAAMNIATKDPEDAPQTYLWDNMRDLQKALADLESDP